MEAESTSSHTGFPLQGTAAVRAATFLFLTAFHFQILENFFDVFNKNANVFCEQLSRAVKSNNKQEIDLALMCKKCTLDVICGKQN